MRLSQNLPRLFRRCPKLKTNSIFLIPSLSSRLRTGWKSKRHLGEAHPQEDAHRNELRKFNQNYRSQWSFSHDKIFPRWSTCWTTLQQVQGNRSKPCNTFRPTLQNFCCQWMARCLKILKLWWTLWSFSLWQMHHLIQMTRETSWKARTSSNFPTMLLTW